MARALRIERAGAWHHVTARGNERRAIFREDRDRVRFQKLLEEAVGMFAWRVHAYVLMDNHFHALIETTQPNLAQGMQWLNVSYSVWFNRRHQRSGHLFQGRYKSVIVEAEAWGRELSRYIHLNPIRIGRMGLGKAARKADRAGAGAAPDRELVRERIKTLRGYRWSSYRAYIGLDRTPSWLTCEKLLESGSRVSDLRQTYRSYVELAARQGLPESPWEKLVAQGVLGGAGFLQEIRRIVKGNAREQAAARRLAERPALEEVMATVEKIKGEDREAFMGRYGDWGRDLILYLARRHCGMKLTELAHRVGEMDYMAASIALHRFQARLKRTPELQAVAEKCEAKLFKC